MSSYQEAYNAAVCANDSSLIGGLDSSKGKLFYILGHYRTALNCFRDAAAVFKKTGNLDKVANNYAAMGRCYALLNNYDSSFFILNEGIDITKKTSNITLTSQLYQNLGVINSTLGEYENAEKYFRLASQNDTCSSSVHLYYLNLAQLFLAASNKDSLELYVQKLKDVEATLEISETSSVSLYDFISNYYASCGQYDSAYVYCCKLSYSTGKIYDKNLASSVLEIQKKYDNALLKNALQKSKIKEQRLIVIICLFTIIATVAVLILSQRSLRITKKEVLTRKRLSLLQNRIKEISDHDKVLEKSLLCRYKIIKDIAYYDMQMTNNTENLVAQIKGHVYDGNSNIWGAISSIVEDIMPGLQKSLRNKYPALNDTQFKICILSCIDNFSNKDIAVFLNFSIYSVNKARSEIRKIIGSDEKNIKKLINKVPK